MCGIIGISSKNRYVKSIAYLMNGLKLLQNRGYDSAGISMVHSIDTKNIFRTSKYASIDQNNSISLLENDIDQFIDCSTGIAHTRWATHGGKTDKNAHPHSYGDFCLVHNGIIENYLILKEFLIKNGYIFQSETDSEVIVCLIHYYYNQYQNIITTINHIFDLLEGTYAIALIYTGEPNKLYCFRHGSPLVIGYNKNKKLSMCSSEILGFGNEELTYTFLEDRNIAILDNGEIMIEGNYQWHKLENREIEIIFDENKYSCWLEKEIFEQPMSVERSYNYGGRLTNHFKLGGLEKNREQLRKIQHLILLGCGTSYYAGLYALNIFRELGIFQTVQIFDGGEFNPEDIPKTNDTVGFILLSQSGETKDLHRCLSFIKGIYSTIGVINVVNSMIAQEVDCGVYLNAGREVSVASTKSYTSMVVVLYLIAGWFANIKTEKKTIHQEEKCSKIKQNLLALSEQISTVLNVDISQIVERISLKKSLFILGKGIGEAVAHEGSLKLKEVAYIHAEGKSAAGLKHGPFALIADKLPILFIHLKMLGSENYTKVQNAITEVRSRDSDVIVIGDYQGADILIPENSDFGGLLSNIIIQRLALAISIKNGINPDYPRNLAKVVTVE